MDKKKIQTAKTKTLLEYSVVYTDRAVNHMSEQFQRTMQDLSQLFKETYHADEVIILPGSGTSAMEAVARQFARGKRCLSLRNGFFNYRWSQIFSLGHIPKEEKVLKAKPISLQPDSPYHPAPIEEVLRTIQEYQPDLVFATHVETSSGIMLSREYLHQVSEAVHAVGGYLVVDAIASGALWLSMAALGIDILITAPQKCWSAPPGCGIVLLSKRTSQYLRQTYTDSFTFDLKSWLNIMHTYEAGKYAYYATMPTNTLVQLRDSMQEAQEIGLTYLQEQQIKLGKRIRHLLKQKGFPSVAAENVASPSIVVVYTHDSRLQSGDKWAEVGIQVSAGVPLKCEEIEPFTTFRVGLLGWDKLTHIDKTINLFTDALEQIC